MTTVVWPIGHYLGEFRPDDDGLEAGHHIRVGGQTIALGVAEMAAWALASDPGDGYAPEAAVTARLAERGVIAVVPPDATVDFARAYRLRPLLGALGRPDATGPYALGLGTQATVLVDETLRDLWWWAARSDTLWTLCGRLDAAAPERVLAHFVEHGHSLLGGAAAYLDVA